MFVMMAVTLYTSRVILDNLGVLDYGIYNVVNSVVFVFLFLNGTMSEATQRFIVYELGKNNKARLHKIFINSVNLHFLISCVVIILCETVGLWFFSYKLDIPKERYVAAMWVYQISIVTSVINIMSVPYNAIIISYERMRAFAYISIIEVAFKLFIAYIISVVVWDKLIVYAILLCLVQVLIRFIYNIYCTRTFDVARYKFCSDKSILKEMISFASWYLLSFIAMVMNNQGVKIVLNIFFGPVANAAYGIGEQVQNAFTTFRANLQTAINPQITKSYTINDVNGMQSLMFASTKYSFYLFWIISLPIFIQTDYMLLLWLKEVPLYTVAFVRLLLIVALMHALSNPLAVAIGAIGRLKKVTILRFICSLLVLPISYYFLKKGYSFNIPLFLYLGSLMVNYVISIIFLNRKMNFEYKIFVRKVFMPAGIVVLSSIFALYFLSLYIQNPLAIIGLSVFICCISIYCLGLSSLERKFIISMIKKHGNCKN